ncbi:MAG: hypothetical protein SNJ76_09330 [Fimbriimonadaceae bacterium]
MGGAVSALLLGTHGSAFAQRGGSPRTMAPLVSPEERDRILSGLPPLVRRMINEASRTRMSGERVVEFRARGERRRHREFIWKDGVRQRIEFSDDSPFAGQVIVETANERQHFFPDRNTIVVGTPRREEILGRMMGIFRRVGTDGFRVEREGDGIVAGIRCEQFAIRDRDGNVLQRLWIEPRSAALLKRELFDATGSRVGLTEWVRVDFSPRFRDDDFVIRRAGARIETPQSRAREEMRRRGFLEVFLPADLGFKFIGGRVLSGPNMPDIYMQVYMSDSSQLSFFQVRGDLDVRRMREQAGPNMRVHSWTRADRTWALLGNIPQAEMERISRRVP